jgi:hypothetical protein
VTIIERIAFDGKPLQSAVDRLEFAAETSGSFQMDEAQSLCGCSLMSPRGTGHMGAVIVMVKSDGPTNARVSLLLSRQEKMA